MTGIDPAQAAAVAEPSYILTSVTTEEVAQHYGSLCESTVDGETLTEWEDLPDSEKARLVLCCQQILQQQPPAVDLIDVLNENIDWDTWSKDENKSEDDQPRGRA